MLRVSDLSAWLPGGLGLRGDFLLDHRGPAAKPGGPVRPLAAHLRRWSVGNLRPEAGEKASGPAVLALRGRCRRGGVPGRVCGDSRLRPAAVGLPGAVSEPRRHHLLSECGELRNSEAGVSLPAGVGGRNAVPQNAGENGPFSLRNRSHPVCCGLCPELPLPDAHYLLIPRRVEP